MRPSGTRACRTRFNVVFGEAIADYNERQRRKDRRITDYLAEVMADRRGKRNAETGEAGKRPAYEVVIGLGSLKGEQDAEGNYMRDPVTGDWLTPYVVPEEIGYKVMRRYIETWEERNPHLYLCGAYFHGDEQGVPHVHADFIPWADGYKRGPDRQCSIGKALAQQGCAGDSMSRNA